MSLSIPTPASLPREIQSIIDDYSSSYDHYLKTKDILEEYIRRTSLVNDFICVLSEKYLRKWYNYRNLINAKAWIENTLIFPSIIDWRKTIILPSSYYEHKNFN